LTLRWHPTPGAMALSVPGGISRLDDSISSHRCSFQGGSAYPGLRSSSSHEVLLGLILGL